MIIIGSVTATVVDGRVVFVHDCSSGRVEATLNSAEWRIVTDEPLTVDPSVACDACGLHGWFTNGSFFGTPGRRLTDTEEHTDGQT